MNTNERIILYLLAAINFTNIMDFMIMMPLGPQLMRLMQISPQQFSILVSAYTFSAFGSGLMASLFVDKYDRKQVLMILYVGFIIGTFLCGLANTYILLLLARIFTGLFGGILSATILSIVGDIIPMERRAHAMGIVMAAFSIASVLGVPFGLYLANIFGWQSPFVFLAVLALPILFLVYKYLPAVNQHLAQKEHTATNPFITIKQILVDRNQRKALFLSMIMMIGHFSIIPFISPYMVANVGFSENQLQYIYLVGGLLTVFTSPFIGKLADRKGKKKIFILFALLCILPILAITNLPPIPVYWALAIGGVFFIFTGGRMIPLQAMVTGAVNPKLRGSFMSINSSVQHLMAGMGSFIAGLIVSKNNNGQLIHYNYVGLLAVCMSIVAVLISLKLTAHDGSKY
ncbi:MAG: MFS transporter [Bacteroidia bacterium]